MASAVVRLQTNSPVIHQRVAKTRLRVREAAARLFNTENFDAVTIEAIVSEAGIARSTFYRLFKDKDSLMRDILVPMFEQAGEHLQQIDSSRPEAIVNGIAESYLSIWADHREALKLSQHLSPPHFMMIREEHDIYAAALQQLMDVIAKAMMLRNDDPYLSSMLLAQTVVKTLQVCEKHPHFETVFCSTLRGMLLKW